MARPSTSDPLDKFRWKVAILQDGQRTFTRLGFTSVQTPEMIINTKNYPEGGNHLFPKKIIESVDYKTITLTRGVTDNQDFKNWAQKYIELVSGVRDGAVVRETVLQENISVNSFGFTVRDYEVIGDRPKPGVNTNPGAYRRTVVIGHLDRDGRVVKKYTLYNAFPVAYKPASDFDSQADDGLSIETLTLAYESFTEDSVAVDSNPLDASDTFKRLVRRRF